MIDREQPETVLTPRPRPLPPEVAQKYDAYVGMSRERETAAAGGRQPLYSDRRRLTQPEPDCSL